MKLSPSNEEILKTFKEIMTFLKKERKSKGNIKNPDLAKKVGITGNYLSALENGRVTPSIETFLRYLIHSGFDLSGFLKLEIKQKKPDSELVRLKDEVSKKLAILDENQLQFILEQIKLTQMIKIKLKR